MKDKPNSQLKTAILITCFNRKEKTSKCLEVLFNQTLPNGIEIQVFLCDDGSSDGTSQLIEKQFPQVIIIKGNGSLFWGGGMRAAWKKAKSFGDFDFFLWLNDDTYLLDNALVELFEDYFSLREPGIVVGSCYDSSSKRLSFGGEKNSSKVLPNGSLQEIELVNGNLVLIPAVIDSALNGISSDFTHYYGDYDYGLRAQKAGFKCLIAKKFLAICDENESIFWGNTNVPLKKRWEIVHDTKGLALSEYYTYLKTHWGIPCAIKTVFSIYLRLLFPDSYLKIRKVFFNQ